MNTRRQFLKHAGTASAVLSTLGSPLRGQEAARPAALKQTLRLGFIGVGSKSSSHNTVRRGTLGELMHGEGGYLHDTRNLKIATTGEVLWQGIHHAVRAGNLYPCHGIGPLAWYRNINRGDRFDFLVSMSSNARGLDLYAAAHLPAEHPKPKRKHLNGDVNTFRTEVGRTQRNPSLCSPHQCAKFFRFMGRGHFPQSDVNRGREPGSTGVSPASCGAEARNAPAGCQRSQARFMEREVHESGWT